MLIVVAAYEVLDGGAAEVGYLTAAIGAGGLLGAFGAVGARRQPAGSAVRLVADLLGRADHAHLTLAIPRHCDLLLAIVGAANSVEDVAAFTLVQRVIPDDVLARVFGVVWGLAMGAVALGSVAATGIVQSRAAAGVPRGRGDPADPRALVSPAAGARCGGPGRAANSRLVEGVPMFAPLSLAAKERIASLLVPRTSSQGKW